MPQITQQIIALSKYLMPASQSDWANAMIAEFHSIPHGPQRWRFAFGCLQVATYERCKTRPALAFIGRFLIGAALIMMGAYGLYWTSQMESPALVNLVGALCICYSVIGWIGVFSLRWLQRLAIGGLITAMASCGLIASGLAPAIDLPADYLAALSLEASGMMLALLFAATYLKFVAANGSETHGMA